MNPVLSRVVVLSLLVLGCDESTPAADDGATDASPVDAATDTPVTDAPVIDAPTTDAPVADTPVIDAPMTDAPVIDVPPADAPPPMMPTTVSALLPCRTMGIHGGSLYCGVGGVIAKIDTATLMETRPYNAPLLTIESLAVDAAGLVWTERAPAMMSTHGALRACPLSDCATTTLLIEQQNPLDLAITPTHAYFLRANNLYAIERGAPRVLRTLPGIIATPTNNGDVATDGATLYWLDPNVDPATGRVLACDPSACTPRVVVGDIAGGRSLTVANGSVYVTGDRETFRVRTDGTGRERLGPPGVDIVADATDVLWVGGDSRGTMGEVYRCRVAGCGGAPQVLATGQSSPWTLAADATHVYWSNLTAGGATPAGLYRVAR